MANPSPAAIAWIEAHTSDWTPGNMVIANTLNGVLVANPVPVTQVPVPISTATLMSVLEDATIVKLNSYTLMGRVLDAINAQDRGALGLWAEMMFKGGTLSQADLTAVTETLSATENDPSWQAQIPQTIVELGRLLDADDVAAARSAGGH